MNSYDELMKSRGYIKIAEHRDGKENLISTVYVYNKDKTLLISGRELPVPVYSVTVWPEDAFQASYSLSTSVNKLVTPRCSSISNDEHFNRIIGKFEKEVALLEGFSKN